MNQKYRSWLGMFIWLSVSSHPELSLVVLLLSTYQSEPITCHLDAVKYAGHYLTVMKDYGIILSSHQNAEMEGLCIFHWMNQRINF